ncbi:MAG TPA: hypothetical protein VF847_00145 [Candidatus Deferrimicrobiaceae bacterium]
MRLHASLSIRLSALFLLAAPCASALDGYRLYESTAASVNGEVLFLSDVAREGCFHRCAAMPGSDPEVLNPQEARERLIADLLVLQEQKKLALGQVDNATLSAYAAEALARMAACGSTCRADIRPEEIRSWVERKLVIRDFFNRRVRMFVEVSDEDVEREIRRRTGAGGSAALTADTVREELLEEKMAQEMRNWYDRAASKARVVLSPLEDK